MFDLQKLKKIDLKDFDLNKVLPLMLEQKDFWAQVAIVIFSLIVLSSMIKGYGAQGQEYRTELQQLKEKADTVRAYEDSVKQLKSFLAAVPHELDEEKFSSLITDFAAQNNIAILSFLPGQKKTEALAETLTVRLSIQAADYKSFVSFLKVIEDAGLRVDSCAPSLQGGRMIAAQMEVSSVGIKK